MAIPNAARQLPNVLITGTPGTGKTETCRLLMSELEDLSTGQISFRNLSVNDIAKEHDFFDGVDEEVQTKILDEDKVLDYMEDLMTSGGKIVDYHSAEMFPERWFDLVIVLRTDNTILWNRLEQRNYSMKKIQENIECEIMQVLLDEARNSYKPEIVQECSSNTIDDMETNVENVVGWIKQFCQNRN
eukprot:145132_1